MGKLQENKRPVTSVFSKHRLVLGMCSVLLPGVADGNELTSDYPLQQDTVFCLYDSMGKHACLVFFLGMACLLCVAWFCDWTLY